MWKGARTSSVLLFAFVILGILFFCSPAFAEVPAPIYHKSNLSFTSADSAIKLSDEEVTKLSGLNGGTITVTFTANNLSVASSLISISRGDVTDGHIHVYLDKRGFLGIEARNHGETRYLNLQAPVEVTENVQHRLAITADPSVGYSFYFDGRFVYQMPSSLLTKWKYNYRFFSSIDNSTVGYLGATYRNGTFAYPYYGTIDDIAIYDSAIDRESLLGMTSTGVNAGPVRQDNVFTVGDWNTEGIRIPSILKTTHGTMIAAGDIRYGDAAGTSNDPPNNCDIGIRISADEGRTWGEPKMLLNFEDYPNEPQVPIAKDSASYCDSLLVEGLNGRVFYFCDAMTGNVRAPYAAASSGYTSEGYLILKDSSGEQYELHENDGVVYKDNSPTNYTVSKDFTLYRDGMIAGNIFYTNYGTYDKQDTPRKTELRVVDTVFLVMMYSDDGGYTWSSPKLMNSGLKASNMKHFGTAPGIGITIKTGKNAGRIIVPIYYNTSSFSGMSGAVLYSDDNGESWSLGKSPNDARAREGLSKVSMGEIQIVEMPSEGDSVSTQLKMFVRQSGGVLIATSYDGGETWDSDMPKDPALIAPVPYGGCQQSVINYGAKIDGKPAVVFANAAANNRSNGTIRIGLINSDSTNATGRRNYSFDWQYKKVIRSGEFGYSSLVELSNGNIGMLYEQESRPDNIHTLVYGEYTLGYLTGKGDVKPSEVYRVGDLSLPLSDGTYPTIDGDELSALSSLGEGTIAVSFTPGEMSSNYSFIGISDSTAGNQNSYFHFYYGDKKLGFEVRRQNGGDFAKYDVAAPLIVGKTYSAVLTASSDDGYRIYLDGVELLHIKPDDLIGPGYGFISSVPNVNAGYIGKTKRIAASGQKAAFEYPFKGRIESLVVYKEVLNSNLIMSLNS